MKLKEFFSPPSTRSPLFITAIKASLLTAAFLLTGIFNDSLVQMSAMSMGVSAAALTDHPAQYHQRLVYFLSLLVSFGLAALSVVALYPHPWLFLIGLCAGTFCLVMASALGPRFGKMGFGALAVAVFTMLSYPHHPDPWWLPLFLVSGSVSYFILSTLLQRLLPDFNLEHDTQQLFSTLAKYQLLKARFFDSGSDPEEIRLTLAKLGAQASNALANVRQQLMLRQQQKEHANHGSGYLELFFKAQVLLERMSSSHLLYQELRQELADTSLPERIQRVLVGLSKRMMRQPRFRRFEHYEVNDQVEAELHELEKSCHRLAERQVFGAHCMVQLSFLLENLKKVCELTQTHTPFPSSQFLFNAQQVQGWRYYWRLFSSPRAQLFRHAARLTSCMLVGYVIIQLLPPDSQNYWLLLTTLFITKPTFSATKQRLLQRIIGTVLGIGVATLLYWLELPMMGLIAIAAFSKFLFFWYLEQRYSIAVACVSIYVAIILQFYGLDAEALFVKRILITTLAAALVFLALRYLWPDWLKKRSRSVLENSLKQIRLYQELIFGQYLLKERVEDEGYRLARFHAHLSEADLVEHWQALLAEPRSKQSEASTLYVLTGRLHAYLSHLSALASHRGRITSDSVLPLIEQVGQQLNSQLLALERFLSDVEKKLDGQTCQKVSQHLSALRPKFYGEELMVLFQLQRLNEDLLQIRQLVSSEGDWQTNKIKSANLSDRQR